MLAKKRKGIDRTKIAKTPRQMERHIKGIACHRRIEILFVIADKRAITLENICSAVKGNVKTISEHTRKLSQAGLIGKYNQGRQVVHVLSPYGKIVYKFLKTFSNL